MLVIMVLARDTGRVRRHPATLPRAPSFGSYVEELGRADRQASLAFWRDTLADIEQPTPLTGERRRDDSEGSAFVPLDLHLPSSVAAKLDTVARTHRVSPGILVFATWALTLARRDRKSKRLNSSH